MQRFKVNFSRCRITQNKQYWIIKHYEECDKFLQHAFNLDTAVTQSQMPEGFFPCDNRSPQISPHVESSQGSSTEESQASLGDIEYQPSGSAHGSSSLGASGSKSPNYILNDVENRIFQESKKYNIFFNAEINDISIIFL